MMYRHSCRALQTNKHRSIETVRGTIYIDINSYALYNNYIYRKYRSILLDIDITISTVIYVE